MIGVLLAVALHGSTAGSDACASLVPPALRAVLTTAYPDHRLVLGTDHDHYHVQQSRKNGGSACLGVARADFDGDGKRDLAVLLASAKKMETLLIAALRDGSGWKLELVETEDVAVRSKYVGTVKPGTHEARHYGEPPLPNQLEKITSRTFGIDTGMLESTARFFFRIDGRWVFVWMAD